MNLTPYEAVALTQHQRELVLAAWLDVDLEQLRSWLGRQNDASLRAMPDGANDHVGGYLSNMHALSTQDPAGDAQVLIQHVAQMCDSLLLWAVRDVSGKDPLEAAR